MKSGDALGVGSTLCTLGKGDAAAFPNLLRAERLGVEDGLGQTAMLIPAEPQLRSALVGD